jgi:hypothetical protein
MNQTYVDHEVYEWEGSYAYTSMVGGFLLTPYFDKALGLELYFRHVKTLKRTFLVYIWRAPCICGYPS